MQKKPVSMFCHPSEKDQRSMYHIVTIQHDVDLEPVEKLWSEGDYEGVIDYMAQWDYGENVEAPTSMQALAALYRTTFIENGLYLVSRGPTGIIYSCYRLISQEKQIPLDDRLSHILLACGIPANVRGFRYIRTAVAMAIEEPAIVGYITTRIYPEVGAKHGTTKNKTERAIRHAIELAHESGKLKKLNEFIGVHAISPDHKPTNGELIALIADRIGLEYK